MCVEEAKKIFEGNVAAVSLEVLQEAAKVILFELGKAEEKISALEKFSTEDLPGEIWRDVEGYKGKYQVSNKGRLKSFHDNNVKILNYSFDKTGYTRITLTLKEVRKYFALHRLIATAFIPNPENKPFVNHIDGNKRNNCLENLEWVTPKENSQHAYKHGLIKKGCENPCSKLTAEQVKFIRQNYKARDKNFGASALGRKFNVNHSVICDVVHRKTYLDVE